MIFNAAIADFVVNDLPYTQKLSDHPDWLDRFFEGYFSTGPTLTEEDIRVIPLLKKLRHPSLINYFGWRITESIGTGMEDPRENMEGYRGFVDGLVEFDEKYVHLDKYIERILHHLQRLQ